MKNLLILFYIITLLFTTSSCNTKLLCKQQEVMITECDSILIEKLYKKCMNDIIIGNESEAIVIFYKEDCKTQARKEGCKNVKYIKYIRCGKTIKMEKL